MKIKEVIVVEGKNDTMKINQAVSAYTIETNGSAINKETLDQISHAKEKRGIIIFTDPDYPGERIRRIVDEHVPGCKHAFLTQDEARDEKSKVNNLGIENASIETIKNALSQVYEREDEEIVKIIFPRRVALESITFGAFSRKKFIQACYKEETD